MATLRNEESEVREKPKQHTLNCDCVGFCDVYEFMLHKRKYREVISAYQNDAEENHTVSGELKVSADLRMVLMLPRVDEFKAACWFSKRLIIFNETIN
ncbi:hypothetical protein ElyMa_005766300 [Elysia marginata]|uniref:Uncharacterized protein n=1 Tax=Elysia marginata TaxID=1093978 RepID=A0AAV4FPK0_9GAST|nr:hypothetical protein ElyMa_005766300 [Elysia marginata]